MASENECVLSGSSSKETSITKSKKKTETKNPIDETGGNNVQNLGDHSFSGTEPDYTEGSLPDVRSVLLSHTGNLYSQQYPSPGLAQFSRVNSVPQFFLHQNNHEVNNQNLNKSMADLLAEQKKTSNLLIDLITELRVSRRSGDAGTASAIPNFQHPPPGIMPLENRNIPPVNVPPPSTINLPQSAKTITLTDNSLLCKNVPRFNKNNVHRPLNFLSEFEQYAESRQVPLISRADLFLTAVEVEDLA